jgi:outer membrane protein assembly factor BamD
MMTHRCFVSLLTCAIALTLAVGCSSTPKKTDPSPKTVSGTDEQIFIGDTVEKNYDPNVIMKRAEAFFDKEDYQEAIMEYRHFLDLHRIHVLAAYAQFKLADSHLKMVKSVDRDPDPMYKAMEQFEKLVRDYAGNRYVGEAKDKIRTCRDLIAQHHFYVGQFYYRREAYLAAAKRFELILKEYPEVDLSTDSLYYLAKTYDDLGATEWAQEKLTLLATRTPNHKYQSEAKDLIAKIERQKASPAMLADRGANGTVAKVDSTHVPPAMPDAITHAPSTGQADGTASAFSGFSPSAGSPQATICKLGAWC